MARPEIIDVWRDNLDSEMALIRDLVDEYPFVGMVGLALFSSSQQQQLKAHGDQRRTRNSPAS